MPTSRKTASKTRRTKTHAPRHPRNRRRFPIWILVCACALLLFTIYYKNANIPTPAIAPTTTSVTYTGTTPCADCEGIKTTLTLRTTTEGAPSSYTLNLSYIGRDTDFTETGTWSTKASDGETIYTLQPKDETGTKTSYQVLNDTQVRQLDGNGDPIPESLPFTLTKTQ